jgi:hypothetical protein
MAERRAYAEAEHTFTYVDQQVTPGQFSLVVCPDTGETLTIDGTREELADLLTRALTQLQEA